MPNRGGFFANIDLMKRLTVVILVVGLLAAPVLSAGAASYSLGKQGDCSGFQPKGDAWINWSGYGFLDWGRSWNSLNWWNGSGWNTYAIADTGRVYGGTNTALAHSTAGYVSGLWSVGAYWWASFAPFNGSSQGPDWYNFNC